jgi:hypothetical protein
MNIDGHKHGAVGESSAVRPEVRCGVCGVEEEVEVEAEDVIAEEAREVRKMHDPKCRRRMKWKCIGLRICRTGAGARNA